MAAGAVANLSVLLTANTAKFSADMGRASKSLGTIRSAALTAQRGIRLAFGGIAVAALVRSISGAVAKAREFRVIVNSTTAHRINRLTVSYQAFGNAAARVVLKLLSVAGPALERIIDRLTAVSLWIESKISPQTLRLVGTIISISAAAIVAYNAFKLVVAIQTIWNTKTKIAVVLQTALNALAGNWVAIAAAAVAATGTVIALNAAFGDFGDDASKDVKGVRSEVDKLKQSMLGLQAVQIGMRGRDFMERSSVKPQSELGKFLAERDDAGLKAIADELAKVREEQNERANRRYIHGGPGHLMI